MKKTLLLLLFALSGTVSVHSQVKLKSEYQSEFYVIGVDSKGVGTYSVFLEVSKADNFGGPTKRTAVVSGPREILRLKREDPARSGSVDYRYWWMEGDEAARRDTNFVYRLPYSIHKNTVRISYTYNVWDRLGGNALPFPFISMIFRTDKGDTIYAARKGKVIRIGDKYDTSNNPELSFSTEVNRMVVQHDDGTTADYSGIEKEGFLVREGDMVYPDTPIAIVGSFDGEKYGFYFAVGYPALTGKTASPLAKRYYRPVFATGEGEKILINNTVNASKVSDELIVCEMSNREKKNYEKRRVSAAVRN